MTDWNFAALGGWLPLLAILGAAAIALGFALLMEAVVGSSPVPAARYGRPLHRRRVPAARRRIHARVGA
jgi:hypothetical protein